MTDRPQYTYSSELIERGNTIMLTIFIKRPQHGDSDEHEVIGSLTFFKNEEKEVDRWIALIAGMNGSS